MGGKKHWCNQKVGPNQLTGFTKHQRPIKSATIFTVILLCSTLITGIYGSNSSEFCNSGNNVSHNF